MKKRNLILLIIGIILLLLVAFMIFMIYKPKILYDEDIYDFLSCSQKYPTSKLKSTSCITKDGRIFIDEESNQLPGKYNHCETHEECIPYPNSCHPKSCVNKKYKNLLTSRNYFFFVDVGCTYIFMPNAAYTLEDCICEQNTCINKNLNRKSLD